MDPSFLSPPDLQQVREILNLPLLEILVRPDWGSTHPHHRQKIKDSLKEKSSQSSFLFTSSISHCPNLGGFACLSYQSQQILQLGFDIEEDHRVREEIAQRICKSTHEYTEAPSAASLWTAKEAAFKSLQGPSQPQTISEITLVDWKVINSQIETVWVNPERTFSFSQVFGVLIKQTPYTFAIFISFSQN